MKRLLYLMSAWVFAIGLHAQSDEEQVLVFRHSGEVNLFYASQLDRIELSAYDADSVLHDEVVSQVFYADDTTMVVPIAEIDSVAFGSRNAIEMRPNVKEMTAETDLPWILRFDGEAIYYRLNTPANILPKVDQRLFYGLDGDTSEAAIFPYGLTAKATAVTTLADEIRVDIETVELNEIFSKFFYAGPIHEEKVVELKQRRIQVHRDYRMDQTLSLGQYGSAYVDGVATIDGSIVLNPLYWNQYRAVHLDASLSYGSGASVTDHGEGAYEICSPYIPLRDFKILSIRVGIGISVDWDAELTFSQDFRRTWHWKIKWTARGDESTWEFPEIPNEEQDEGKSRTNILLNGRLYISPFVGIDIVTIKELVGARAKLKLGEEFEGNLGVEVLNSLQEYNPELYLKGTLQARHKVALETFWVNRDLLTGNSEEHPLVDFPYTFGERTINLFPEFEQTRGVEATHQTETEVTVSTKVGNEIIKEVEMGFELVDENDNVIDSLFVDDLIQPDTTMVQGFDASFELPKRTDPDALPLRVRPIFHYAGYTIRHQDTNVLHDSHLMPITAYGTNGVTTFISGASVVGTAKSDSVVYNVGNYLPVPVFDPVFPPVWDEPKTPGKHINEEAEENLFGTWRGEIDGDIVELTFNDDDAHTGTYLIDGHNHTFTYDLNTPQSGDVRLLLDDETTVIFTIVSVNDTTLMIHKKGKQELYTLNKQY